MSPRTGDKVTVGEAGLSAVTPARLGYAASTELEIGGTEVRTTRKG